MLDRNSKIWNCGLVCTLLITSSICFLLHPPIEGQQAAPSVSLETASVEVEYNQDGHDKSPALAESPLLHQEFVWGWNGNLSFEYWNDTLDQGIENAIVQYWWGYDTGFAIEIGNGTYAIPIDTRQVFPGGPYPLTIFASKPGQDSLNELVYIMIHEVPTEIVIDIPTENQPEWPFDLYVPYGDSINITLFYNDTDSSDGYVGGIPDADPICQVWGPTLPLSDYPVIELGNGYYQINLDSLNPNLYVTTGGEPVLSRAPYFLYTLLRSQNRSESETTLRISIIETPTLVEIVNYFESFLMYEGELFILELQYTDTWHNIPIGDANILVNSSNPDVFSLVTITNQTGTDLGLYTLEFQSIRAGMAIVTITFEKDFHEPWSETIIVQVEPNPWPPPPPPIYGLPITVLIIVALFIYSRKKPNASSETGSLPNPGDRLEVASTLVNLIPTTDLETGSFSIAWKLYFLISTILAVLFLSGLI